MQIKKDTIIRTAVLALALANQVLTSTGHSPLPVTGTQLTDAITLGFTVGASVWAWWKNNSFTKNAIQADSILRSLKKEGDNNE